jgi:hypothetical protein
MLCWASKDEVGCNGDNAGQSTTAWNPGEEEADLLRGFSVASMSDRGWTGDLVTLVAIGRLGSGLSDGLPCCKILRRSFSLFVTFGGETRRLFLWGFAAADTETFFVVIISFFFDFGVVKPNRLPALVTQPEGFDTFRSGGAGVDGRIWDGEVETWALNAGVEVMKWGLTGSVSMKWEFSSGTPNVDNMLKWSLADLECILCCVLLFVWCLST